jgi:ubiquinone/menaquinone biosynthesis C-methylase UbiE
MPEQYALAGSAAELYERNMVPALFRPFAEDLMDHAALRKGEHVLDVACGTGIVSRLAWSAVAPSGHVIGLDLNPKMLDVARTVGQGDGASIDWIEGDAAAMPVPDFGFDVTCCQCGLPYFPDRPAALAEMNRVLKVGGRLVANVLRAIAFNPGHRVFADVLEQHVSPKAAATRRAPFQLWQKEEIRTLLSQAGFKEPRITLSCRIARFPSAQAMVSMMMAGTPLGAEMADAAPDLLARVVNEVTAGLADYEDDLGLALPMQAWTIVAHK